MIVLDASVMIAHMVGGDAHAERAFEILDTEDELMLHPMTAAESLVGPVRVGREAEALAVLTRLGVERHVPADDEPVELARLRAETGLRLPGCCVLAAALVEGASLATFDTRLARAARERGVDVIGADEEPAAG
ncbi:PIN domain-containing protein [Microbacterium betulae]|uniref:Ribonuclease VapC n=1 Tax=Microbacterium betulae TaxID=2981139 RepID=A0AA97I5I7_9MICO|nr:PIN domain-containing protein [Microbacterium sp. AB]WOF21525.1 PIN domain-containing protein [Microbacterium sp. AB]